MLAEHIVNEALPIYGQARIVIGSLSSEWPSVNPKHKAGMDSCLVFTALLALIQLFKWELGIAVTGENKCDNTTIISASIYFLYLTPSLQIVYYKELSNNKKSMNPAVVPGAHGTFLGLIRLEPNKPHRVLIDFSMSFGAFTWVYIVWEKPQTQSSAAGGEMNAGEDEELKGLLGFPEEETQVDVCRFKLCLPLSVLSRMLKKVWNERRVTRSIRCCRVPTLLRSRHI